MVYWITGRKNSGKTTLARRIQKQIPCSIIIDGDKVREVFANDFTDEGREENQRNLARIARLVEDQGIVAIVACVSPRRALRKSLQANFRECIEIQLPFGELWKGTEYEEEPLKEDRTWQMEKPQEPATSTSGCTAEESAKDSENCKECRRPSTVWSVRDTIPEPHKGLPPLPEPGREASAACGGCYGTVTDNSDPDYRRDKNFRPVEGPSI